jgi:septum formation protein
MTPPDTELAPLILASSSPRRAELLRAAGIPFEVRHADVPEVRAAAEPPIDYARRLAADKARAVARRFPDRSVLGADTIVCVDHHVLEKPRDADDAAAMLRLLSGRWHEVTTAVCLIAPGAEHIAHETTRVQCQPLSDADIAGYVATGEPMDKAGAYAIQGIASRWISRIEGDYGNVVGLPVALVYRLLRENGRG